MFFKSTSKLQKKRKKEKRNVLNDETLIIKITEILQRPLAGIANKIVAGAARVAVF